MKRCVLGLATAFLAVGTVSSAQAPSLPTPVGDSGAWFTPDDYPAAALAAEEEGAVKFTLSVDAAGSVTDCAIVGSSGSVSLDTATCQLARQRAHFRPALDWHGHAMASHYTRRTVWRMPQPEPIPITAFSQTALLDVSAQGALLSCKADIEGKFPIAVLGNACTDPPNDPALLETMKGPMAGRHTIVFLQFMMTPDGQTPFQATHKKFDAHATALAVLHLDIGTDGKIATCKPIEAVGTMTLAHVCDAPIVRVFDPSMDRFGPLRGVTMLVSSGTQLIGPPVLKAPAK